MLNGLMDTWKFTSYMFCYSVPSLNSEINNHMFDFAVIFEVNVVESSLIICHIPAL